MYRLKLIKGRTYWGAGVKASQEKPFVEVETIEHAEKLVKTGYFAMDESVQTSNSGGVNVADEEDEEGFDFSVEDEEAAEEDSVLAELQKKKKDELVKYASEHGIDITGCKTRDDIISKIFEALARASVARDAIRNE